jgi:hypothetical protein
MSKKGKKSLDIELPDPLHLEQEQSSQTGMLLFD